MTRIKICGLQNPEDAAVAEALGAEYLGVVLSPGFGRSLSIDRAAEVLADATVRRVAVLVDESAEVAAEKARAIDAHTVQLHGGEPPEVAAALRREGFEVWKAVRARTPADVTASVERYEVSGHLVEGFAPGIVGGGGVRLEVDADAVRAAVPTERIFVLAGGLIPETVALAVEDFRPDVVDVSSGVESAPGRKDHELLRRFFTALRSPPPPASESAT